MNTQNTPTSEEQQHIQEELLIQGYPVPSDQELYLQGYDDSDEEVLALIGRCCFCGHRNCTC